MHNAVRHGGDGGGAAVRLMMVLIKRRGYGRIFGYPC